MNQSNGCTKGASQSIRESLRITLVEAGDLSKVRDWIPQPDIFSNRVSSLTNASRHFLKGVITSTLTTICPNIPFQNSVHGVMLKSLGQRR